MAYQISLAPSFLYGIGVSCHASGTLSLGSRKVFDYYKTDKVTQEQKEQILAWCKDARFYTTSPQFAPELKTVAIAFPKAAFYQLTPKQKESL